MQRMRICTHEAVNAEGHIIIFQNAEGRMRPSNPHFFKFLVSDFRKKFWIPTSFSKYLDGQKSDNANLRSSRGGGEKIWPVKLNGRQFEDGWMDFIRDHDLHEGDFLLFRHLGNFVFDVMVFDQSTYVREYPPSDNMDVDSLDDENDSAHEKSVHYLYEPGDNTPTNKKIKKHSTRLNATSFGFENPYFVTTVKPYEKFRLFIPQHFARSNDLTNGSYNKMILMDEKQELWLVRVGMKKREKNIYIAKGWYNFCIANGIKSGDSFIFELIKKGKTPMLKFHRMQKGLEGNSMAMQEMKPKAIASSSALSSRKPRSMKNCEHITPKEGPVKYLCESEENSQNNRQITRRGTKLNYTLFEFGNPYFVATMKPSYNAYKLVIPYVFVRSNGLCNGSCSNMILRDEKQKLWPVEVVKRKSNDVVFIGHGWHPFCIANGLKDGDSFIFELIEKGKTPILKFHRLGENSMPVQETTTLKSTTASAPRPKNINKWEVNIPKEESLMHLHEYPITEKKKQIKMLNTKASATSLFENPCFEVTIKPSNNGSRLFIPQDFARLNGLGNRSCGQMILIDQKRKEWPVKLQYKKCENRVYIGRGWHHFHTENGLKEGDSFALELIMNGKMPIMKFHWLEENYMANQEMTPKEKVSSSTPGHTYFCGSLKPIDLEKGRLYIPEEFARLNGICKNYSDAVLKNKKGKFYQVNLAHGTAGRVYLSSGWKEFAAENGLKEGDEFMLELIKGKKLAMNFYGSRDNC